MLLGPREIARVLTKLNAAEDNQLNHRAKFASHPAYQEINGRIRGVIIQPPNDTDHRWLPKMESISEKLAATSPAPLAAADPNKIATEPRAWKEKYLILINDLIFRGDEETFQHFFNGGNAFLNRCNCSTHNKVRF